MFLFNTNMLAGGMVTCVSGVCNTGSTVWYWHPGIVWFHQDQDTEGGTLLRCLVTTEGASCMSNTFQGICLHQYLMVDIRKCWNFCFRTHYSRKSSWKTKDAHWPWIEGKVLSRRQFYRSVCMLNACLHAYTLWPIPNELLFVAFCLSMFILELR